MTTEITNQPPAKTFQNKKDAIAAARALRAAGQAVKTYRHINTYCQPGKGVTVAIWYEVR